MPKVYSVRAVLNMATRFFTRSFLEGSVGRSEPDYMMMGVAGMEKWWPNPFRVDSFGGSQEFVNSF